MTDSPAALEISGLGFSFGRTRALDDIVLGLGTGEFKGRCQTNLNRPAKGACLRRSSRELTPFGQSG